MRKRPSFATKYYERDMKVIINRLTFFFDLEREKCYDKHVP